MAADEERQVQSGSRVYWDHGACLYEWLPDGPLPDQTPNVPLVPLNTINSTTLYQGPQPHSHIGVALTHLTRRSGLCPALPEETAGLTSSHPLAELRQQMLSHGEGNQHTLSIYYPRHFNYNSHNNPGRKAALALLC